MKAEQLFGFGPELTLFNFILRSLNFKNLENFKILRTFESVCGLLERSRRGDPGDPSDLIAVTSVTSVTP